MAIIAYDPRARVAYRERLGQQTDMFNAASQGAIRLVSASKPGVFDINSFFQRASGTVSRRDTTSSAAQTAAQVSMVERAAVKLFRKLGLYKARMTDLRKIGEMVGADTDPEDAIMTGLGETYAEESAQEKLNTGIAAVGAVIRGNAAVTHDASTATITTAGLNSAFFKRGDRNSDIKAVLMHSKVVGDLIGQQIATNATGVASVVMAGGSPLTLGRPILMTDSPSLMLAGGKFLTLGLVDGAVVLEDTEEETILGMYVGGNENIEYTAQGEYAYNTSVLGYGWNMAVGGENPTPATLSSAANWTATNVDAIKNGPGVALITL